MLKILLHCRISYGEPVPTSPGNALSGRLADPVAPRGPDPRDSVLAAGYPCPTPPFHRAAQGEHVMSAYFIRFALAGLACALAAPASAQTIANKDLSIDAAV